MSGERCVPWLSVGIYYALACGISWPFFWWRDMAPESWQAWPAPGILKTMSYMWGPGAAALVVLFLFRKTHRRRITLWGASLIRSLAFYLVPLVVLAVVGLTLRDGTVSHTLPLALAGLAFFSIFGEELGWRGFLQDALRPLPAWKRYALLGVLWEFWHFTAHVRGRPFPALVLVPSIFYAATILLSWGMGAATERSRSLFIPLTLHAWVDLLFEFPSVETGIVFVGCIPLWACLLISWPAPTLAVAATPAGSGNTPGNPVPP